MATYNKRGYKAPKPEVEKVETNLNDLEPLANVDEKSSTTAGVFNTLDEKASKAEEFIEKNQKLILSILGGVALLTLGYLMYNKFIVNPKEQEGASQLYQAQQYFQQAVDAPVATDSLFKLALNGGEGKQGFLDIIKNGSSSKAVNLAHYYAGMSYLNMKQFQKAFDELEQYNGGDVFTKALAIGAMGDAKSELNKPAEALELYVKAAESNANDFTTPRFLLKAGQTAYALGKKEDALKYFTQIKEKYDTSQESQNIDALIGMVE